MLINKTLGKVLLIVLVQVADFIYNHFDWIFSGSKNDDTWDE